MRVRVCVGLGEVRYVASDGLHRGDSPSAVRHINVVVVVVYVCVWCGMSACWMCVG